MKTRHILVTTLFCCIAATTSAKQGDLLQEVKISASSQEADIKNNQLIFNGPVIVTQGSIEIKADQLRAYSKDNNSSKILVATGKPATYFQIMDDGKPANASANEIRYELASRTLTLLGNATLEQEGSQVAGTQIRYNIAKQQLIAEGSGDERVITIIQPENYQTAEPSDPIDKTPSTELKQEPSAELKQKSTAEQTDSNDKTSALNRGQED